MIFPSGVIVLFAINQADAGVLSRYFGQRAGWLPNLTEPSMPPSAARVREVRAWLARQLGEAEAPIWLLPCRLLRRKNVAEALLLTRWLRPEAWLVTTGEASSADERYYAKRLSAAARQAGWRLRLGLLAGDESHKPSVPEILASSECVLLTSLQEGFGLPYLEAAAADRPFIARMLPGIAPDLSRFGFRFPQSYGDLLIEPSLFGWTAEVRRQRSLFRAWRGQLPASCRGLLDRLGWLRSSGPARPVPFSRLTLTAQLEVLSQPLARSWELCLPLNPFLSAWKQRATAGRLQAPGWPKSANGWLNGAAYAQRFWSIAFSIPTPLPRRDLSAAAQLEFMRRRLAARNLFPLLWATQT